MQSFPDWTISYLNRLQLEPQAPTRSFWRISVVSTYNSFLTKTSASSSSPSIEQATNAYQA